MASHTEEILPLLADDGNVSEGEHAGATAPPADLEHVDGDELAPPPYHPTQQLVATTPVQSKRYDKNPLSLDDYPVAVEIATGLFCFTAPPIPPVPEGWLEFVHPEGQNYFYHAARRIITEVNLRIFNNLQRVIQAAGLIDTLLTHLGLTLPTSTELLIELGDDDSDGGICRYYLVDHIRRTIFWLEQTNSENLDLPPVSSMVHLKLLFLQHYWSHVEFFPMHIALPVSVEEELIAILSHACIDSMTSDLSTVPYSQDQCESFIKIITRIPDSRRIDGYRNSVMARLWSEIAGNYFVNLHGESSARLSRNQRLLPLPEVTTTGVISLVKKALFNVPEKYHETLQELWVDKIAYASHWRTYMAACLKDWRQMSNWAMMLLISSFGIFGVSMVLKSASSVLVALVQSASLLSILFCLISISSSLALLRHFKHHAEVHASEAVDFLENACHQIYGLQPLAIIISLPYASLIWGYVSFAICILLLSFTIDILPFKIFIWAAVSIALGAGCLVLLFMNIGAAALSTTRIRATFPVLQERVPWPFRMGSRVAVRTFTVARRMVDVTASIIFRELRRLRHGRAHIRGSPEEA